MFISSSNINKNCIGLKVGTKSVISACCCIIYAWYEIKQITQIFLGIQFYIDFTATITFSQQTYTKWLC
ncbi:hypothetical protein PS15p_202116 [Mucor circinelloides]